MIVTMQKVFIFGTAENKDRILQKLQQAGVVHVEPVEETRFPCLKPEESLTELDQALEILSPYCPSSRMTQTPVEAIPSLALEASKKLREMEEKKNLQKQKLSDMEIWGDFSSALIQSLQEEKISMRFWKCQPKDVALFKAKCIPWQKQEGNTVYLITISYQEALEAPSTAQECIFAKGTREIKEEIAQTEKEIAAQKDLLEQYAGSFASLRDYSRRLKDQIVMECTRHSLLDKGKIFGLKGWVPQEEMSSLKEKMKELPVAIESGEIQDGDTPPTLMRNPKWIQSILDIIKIYATPGYKEWDPSFLVYCAFAVFFAMIVGDGGYGLAILGLTLYFRNAMKKSEAGQRVYRLLLTISLSTIFWGAISCTWFALDMNKISADSPFAFLTELKKLQICDTNDTNGMMLVAIYIGVIHLCLAHVVQIFRQWGSSVILANMGWITGMWGGLLHLHLAHPAGKYLFFVGLGLVFLFTGTSKNILGRIAEGFLGILGVSQTFADIMSYLRLFALGLAGTVMGSIFNQLGMDIQGTIPGISGYILMMLLVFFGHTLNLGIAVMGGFIHGLRLNFLEFYRYCFEGTGHEYRPMALHKR